MLNWAQLGLALAKIVLLFLDWAREKRQFNAGHDAAVLEASRELMRRSEKGKLIDEKIDAMSKDQLGDLIDDLAGDGTPAAKPR